MYGGGTGGLFGYVRTYVPEQFLRPSQMIVVIKREDKQIEH